MAIEEYDGVIINKVTLAKYKELKAANQLVTSQAYVITDLDERLEELELPARLAENSVNSICYNGDIDNIKTGFYQWGCLDEAMRLNKNNAYYYIFSNVGYNDSGRWGVQIAIDENNREMYFRSRADDLVWSNWKRVLNSTDLSLNLLVLEDETKWCTEYFTIEISNDNIITINNSVNSSDSIYKRFGRLNLPAGTYKFGAIVKGGSYTSTQYNYTIAVSYGGHDYEVYPWADDYEPIEFTLDKSTEVRIAFWCDANMTFDNFQLELSIIKENNLIADLSNNVGRIDNNLYWQVRVGRVIVAESEIIMHNQDIIDMSSLPINTILMTIETQNNQVFNYKIILSDDGVYKLRIYLSDDSYYETIARGSLLSSMDFDLEYDSFTSSGVGKFIKITYIHEDLLSIIDNLMRINNYDF